MFRLVYTPQAQENLAQLSSNTHYTKQYKAVMKSLLYLQNDPRHPSLNTHKLQSFPGYDVEVFEAYAQNRTPGAYRIFWHYGPDARMITIIAITKHPD